VKKEQFLVTLERDKKSAVEDALEEMVNDKLLEIEAKKRNITVDQLVRSERFRRKSLSPVKTRSASFMTTTSRHQRNVCRDGFGNPQLPDAAGSE
jgi:hypothetical protein